MIGGKYHDILNTLCPMHIVFEYDGQIVSAGPTARKICPEGLLGRNFLDVFEIKRPREISTLDALRGSTGGRLNLRLRQPPQRQLKGVLAEGPETGQMTVNLSFGISVVDAVQDYDLTAADFAPTDLTVEMLYLVEAKSAAMDASRQLNERLQAARVAAEEQALTDTLTGLRNRRAMDQQLAAMIRIREPFALMHADLDYFKAVNDTLGHAAGDFVLQQVSSIMTSETRKIDVVARVGGDEFVILVRGCDDRVTVSRIAERILDKLKHPMRLAEETCRISGSIGIVLASDYRDPSPDQLLGDADAALYAAKHEGRGRYVFCTPEIRCALPEESAQGAELGAVRNAAT
jgi:diguanylate cyclase (GGDEF)-like protein